MEKLQHLKERICSFENLYAAYEDAAKEKHYREDVLAFTFNLEENLFDLQKDLLDGTYTVGPYREVYVKYPKPRLGAGVPGSSGAMGDLSSAQPIR